MLTIEQIEQIHIRPGSPKTFPEVVRTLKALGVERYDAYLVDGHSEYFARGGRRLVSPAAHRALAVAEASRRETFLEHLHRYALGETTYLEMSIGLAASGIEKWIVDMGSMTMTFYDVSGREMLVVEIA
jgi:uncharacterized protein YbcV (DUF1398 family)